ncbi:unnamed protein product [Calypogeia fissa]
MPDLLLRFDRPRSGESAQSSSARSWTELNSRKAAAVSTPKFTCSAPKTKHGVQMCNAARFHVQEERSAGQARRGITFSNCQIGAGGLAESPPDRNSGVLHRRGIGVHFNRTVVR